MIGGKYYVCVSGSVLSLLYCLVFVSTLRPWCVEMVLAAMYICSVFCLVQLVLSCQVCFAVDPFLTAEYCPLPHLEAEQVICLETVAVCPLIIEMLTVLQDI